MMKYYKNAQDELFIDPIVENHTSLTEITEQEFYDQLTINNSPPDPTVEELRKQAMMSGINFNDTMCSALKEDMWGLNAIKDFIIAGNSIPFEFMNGNTLLLTPENLSDFEAVWVPFRAGFFSI